MTVKALSLIKSNNRFGSFLHKYSSMTKLIPMASNLSGDSLQTKRQISTINNNLKQMKKMSNNYRIDNNPSPPRLSQEEQEEFEKLQKQVATEDLITQYNEKGEQNGASHSSRFSPEYRNTIPEFEGNINPKTGEVNGPKQDPIRHGDWSFNGRATDF